MSCCKAAVLLGYFGLCVGNSLAVQVLLFSSADILLISDRGMALPRALYGAALPAAVRHRPFLSCKKLPAHKMPAWRAGGWRGRVVAQKQAMDV